jgi:gliding motility-associated-like protein
MRISYEKPLMLFSLHDRMRSTILLIISIFLLVNHSLFAQVPESGDCLGAFPVCALNYNQQLSFSGQGAYPGEVNGAISCLNSGERNNSWYLITVQTPGNLGFNIIPNCDDADYDFAVFNLTNASCAEIATNAALEVSCNFSGATFPTPVTGANGGPNPQDSPFIPVLANEVYAIVVNNFTGANQCGYILDFGIPGSTAGILDLTEPEVNGLTTNVNCGSNSLTISYSEFVKCNTVRANEFVLLNPSGQNIPITGVIGTACVNGGAYEKEFVITLGQELFEGGDYILKGFGRVEDNCGNFSPDTQFVFFNLPTVLLTFDVTAVDCRLSNGTATANVDNSLGGTPPYLYTWTPSNQITQTATGLPFGWQYITVVDNQGCTVRDSIFIPDVSNFDVQVVVYEDTCSFGLGRIEAYPSGGNPYTVPPHPYGYEYFFDVTNQPNDRPFADSLITGDYVVSVVDSFGCRFETIVNVPDFRFSLVPDFLFSPDDDPITGILPTVQFLNQSENATEFIWDFDSGEFSTEFEPDYIFPGSGPFDVKLIAINPFGCKDSIVKRINIEFNLSFFAPNAFTPNNDNVNDSFRVIVTGILDSTFIMTIYDRWGQEVFRTLDVKDAWTGKKNNSGKDCPSGQYMYRLSFVDQSGKKSVINGRIFLL